MNHNPILLETDEQIIEVVADGSKNRSHKEINAFLAAAQQEGIPLEVALVNLSQFCGPGCISLGFRNK